MLKDTLNKDILNLMQRNFYLKISFARNFLKKNKPFFKVKLNRWWKRFKKIEYEMFERNETCQLPAH